MFIQKKKRIVADDELVDNTIQPNDGANVDVAPEATELLFETEDVAQLLSEVTGEDVEATVDDESGEVVIAVGNDEFTITPDEDAEILESSRRNLRGKKSVKASTNRPPKSNSRVIKKFSN